MELYYQLPIKAQEILSTAFEQIEDADYEGKARVIIGCDMVLIDNEEFDELKALVCDTSTKFEDIVQL